MKSILGHVGAWSPRAEQVATARFLNKPAAVNAFMDKFKNEIEQRLRGFYDGLMVLKNEGFAVDSIAPQAAIYLTVRFELKGKIKENGEVLETTEHVTSYLLNEAKLAIVPFYAFGASRTSSWYRLSVGTASMDDVSGSISSLRLALAKLK